MWDCSGLVAHLLQSHGTHSVIHHTVMSQPCAIHNAVGLGCIFTSQPTLTCDLDDTEMDAECVTLQLPDDLVGFYGCSF